MAYNTYTDIKTALANWSARSDLTSYLDDFIDAAEDMMKRPPAQNSPGGIRAEKTRVAASLSAGTATLSLPADFLELDAFSLTGTDGGVVQYVVPEQLRLAFRTGSGKPAFYTISDVIELDIAPDSAYAYQLSYWPVFDALSGSQASNWVMANHPFCYLAGSMYYLSRFIQDDEEAARWLSDYTAAAWGASKAYARGRRSQGPIAMRTDGATP